jgi:hypothetical protein
MLDLGSTEFVLSIESLPEQELKRLSTSLFDDWEDFVDTGLSLPDYSLFLQVEEGSVRGVAKIGAVAVALYVGIGNYGDFISGVKTIGEQLTATSDFLAEQAKQTFHCPDTKASTRKRGGAVAGLQRLFVRVQRGEISPEQAMTYAERILGEERNDPPGMLADIADAFRNCPRQHEQQAFPFQSSIEEQTEPIFSLPPTPTKRREPFSGVELGPPLHLRIEVWRDSKKKRRKTRVVKL